MATTTARIETLSRGLNRSASAAAGLPAAGIAALLAALVVGGVVAYRRRGDGDGEGARAVATGTAAESDIATTESGTTAGESDAAATGSDTTAAARSELDGDADASGESGGESGDSPPVDSDLLSNGEQVLRLVESEGGRMKQKRVAEELDWTAAKTSQVVTGLRDEGDLDGFRLGRENVLSLPEYDPAVDASGDEAGDRDAERGDGGGDAEDDGEDASGSD
jgi:hypothetical protein